MSVYIIVTKVIGKMVNRAPISILPHHNLESKYRFTLGAKAELCRRLNLKFRVKVPKSSMTKVKLVTGIVKLYRRAIITKMTIASVAKYSRAPLHSITFKDELRGSKLGLSNNDIRQIAKAMNLQLGINVPGDYLINAKLVVHISRTYLLATL